MTRAIFNAVLFALLLASPAGASPISYQGRLSDNGAPANGVYDFRVEVVDLNLQPVAGPEVVTNVSVVDGLFSLSVDFAGHDFSGQGESLLIGVREASGGAFVTLGSQPILNGPRAVFAEKSGMTFNDIYANGSLFDLTGKFLNIFTGTSSGNGGLLLQDEAKALGVFGKFNGGISTTMFGKMSNQQVAMLGVSQSSDQAFVLLDNAVTGQSVLMVQPNTGGLLRVQGSGGEMEFDAGTGVLDVQGGVKADSFEYLAPKERIVNYPPAGFTPAINGVTYQKDGALYGEYVTPVYFSTPVQLPQGAKVTGVYVRVFDNSSTDNFGSLSFRRFGLDGQVGNTILRGGTNGTPGAVTIFLPYQPGSTPDMLVIDNTQYYYDIAVDLGGDDVVGQRHVKWAQIRYTVDEPE